MTPPSPRVWVTRDEPADGPLSAKLRSHGVEVVHAPLVQRMLLTDARREIESLGPDDWLVLTSPFAVEHAWCNPQPRVAAVGLISAAAAEARGFRVQHVASERNAASLFSELQCAAGSIVLYPRSSQAHPPIESRVRSLVMYETSPRSVDVSSLGRIDMVTVTSASAARELGEIRLPIASIGRTTSAACAAKPVVECDEPSLARLAEMIADWLAVNS